MSAALAERRRDTLCRHNDREHRLPRICLGHGPVDRIRDVVCRGGDGRHEEDDQRVDLGVGEHERQCLRVRVGGRAAEHVDRVAEARLGREERRELLAGLCGQVGELQPDRLADVRAEDPQASCVGQQADPSTPRLGLAREQRGDVDELLERCRADDAGLVEERVDRRLGACERRRVRAGGALAGGGRPALQGQDRLAARDAAREPAEAARVAERLEVEEHDARGRIVLPPLEQVVRRDVGLVPDRDERRQPEAPRLGRFEEGDARARRSATRSRCCRSRAGRAAKVAFRRRPRDGDAEAVGADQASSVRANEL